MKEKAIVETIKFYGLLERPLTEMELHRYLSARSGKISFFDLIKTVQNSPAVKESISQRNGLLFFGKKDPTASRIKKIKISQQKWKILKRKIKWLSLTPFYRAILLTGSMNLFNCVPRSDFDLLIIAPKNRIWLSRFFFVAVCELFGMRRKTGKTKNRFCLNCFICEDHLEIPKKAKPRNFYSAQEYSRAKALLQKENFIFANFQKENGWIKNFLKNYPWPENLPQKNNFINIFLKISKNLESLLGASLGNWMEKKAGEWQLRRINLNSHPGPTDQIYTDPSCLMFHPNSKSFEVMKKMEN